VTVNVVAVFKHSNLCHFNVDANVWKPFYSAPLSCYDTDCSKIYKFFI